MTITKDVDERKALEVRQTVADKEEETLLDKLNNIESLQNKYDYRQRQLKNYAPSVATSSAIKKPDSDEEETVVPARNIIQKIKDIFNTFMKRWRTEVLSGLSDEQLRTYVSNFTVEDMKDWFMEDGQKMEAYRQTIQQKVT